MIVNKVRIIENSIDNYRTFCYDSIIKKATGKRERLFQS